MKPPLNTASVARSIFDIHKTKFTFKTFFDEFVYKLGSWRFYKLLIFPEIAPSYTLLTTQMEMDPTVAMALSRNEAPSKDLALLFRWAKLLLTHWNWKAAVLSVSLRAPIFAIGALRSGATVLWAAVVTETAVSVFNSGFYASIVQLLRNRKPVWLTGLLIVVILPALGQAIEFAAHAINGTPHRRIAFVFSCLLSALSALFNWHVMSHGTLLVAEERTPFGRDLRRLPRLIAQFVLIGPRWIAKTLVADRKKIE